MPKSAAPADAIPTSRRTNEDRSRETRAALLRAARNCFVETGYAATSTPEIARQAKVTRGALYHHFADKADLLTAVVRQEAQAVADEINEQASQPESALGALVDGTRGYFCAMSKPGRARLLLQEGPSTLGLDAMSQLNNETSTATLKDGLAVALGVQPDNESIPVDAISEILGAGFDRAALAVAQGESEQRYQRAFEVLFESLIKHTDNNPNETGK